MAASKKRIAVGGGNSGPLARPFAGLADLRAAQPAGPAGSVTGAASAAPAASPAIATAKKIVLRRERKGHGGKVATRIEGLSAGRRELEILASSIRRAFGCGAAVDESDIVVQGDQVERLVAYLTDRGAARVVIGS